ncbi:hypothetical protein JRO89_XS08G0193100 [Xanthoceras sorbifolium]|uniref:CCHC-type domain-containing protein n=1 Tax=Xanthoceras sorbifolium TaxID=99658 RepID=A0ABQ8HQM4_9ROSI|nr:hypothetical protein JRO89_XS08G0193100 [Xanthoceras sorbifolium]
MIVRTSPSLAVALVVPLLEANDESPVAPVTTSVLTRGPQNFDNSLLVLEEPKGVGNLIGAVVDIDLGPSGDCVDLRVRVCIDSNKPLIRGLKVVLDESGVPTIMLLRYERLPKYCFKCGVLGHPFRECSTNLGVVGDDSGFVDLKVVRRAVSPSRGVHETVAEVHNSGVHKAITEAVLRSLKGLNILLLQM